jgi:hypothetical protein
MDSISLVSPRTKIPVNKTYEGAGLTIALDNYIQNFVFWYSKLGLADLEGLELSRGQD